MGDHEQTCVTEVSFGFLDELSDATMEVEQRFAPFGTSTIVNNSLAINTYEIWSEHARRSSLGDTKAPFAQERCRENVTAKDLDEQDSGLIAPGQVA
jgi:hypothetical protein